MAKREEIVRALGELGPRGRGRPYPAELQKKIVRYVDTRRADGVQLKAIGDELGLSWRTLGRWSPGRERGFRRVEVSPTPRTAAFTVHGPHGIHVDGLDLDELAELIRRLG